MDHRNAGRSGCHRVTQIRARRAVKPFAATSRLRDSRLVAYRNAQERVDFGEGRELEGSIVQRVMNV